MKAGVIGYFVLFCPAMINSLLGLVVAKYEKKVIIRVIYIFSVLV